MKQLKLFMFYMKELSLTKYITYLKKKTVGKSMLYFMCNLDKESVFYILILTMIFYNSDDKEKLRTLLLDKAYGRNYFKDIGTCDELINIIVKSYNETI